MQHVTNPPVSIATPEERAWQRFRLAIIASMEAENRAEHNAAVEQRRQEFVKACGE